MVWIWPSNHAWPSNSGAGSKTLAIGNFGSLGPNGGIPQPFLGPNRWHGPQSPGHPGGHIQLLPYLHPCPYWQFCSPSIFNYNSFILIQFL